MDLGRWLLALVGHLERLGEIRNAKVGFESDCLCGKPLNHQIDIKESDTTQGGKLLGSNEQRGVAEEKRRGQLERPANLRLLSLETVVNRVWYR